MLYVFCLECLAVVQDAGWSADVRTQASVLRRCSLTQMCRSCAMLNYRRTPFRDTVRRCWFSRVHTLRYTLHRDPNIAIASSCSAHCDAHRGVDRTHTRWLGHQDVQSPQIKTLLVCCASNPVFLSHCHYALSPCCGMCRSLCYSRGPRR